MKTTDKVLIGIVIGIVLLIIVALVITLLKPEATYQAEDTPEGVAHNYLLALQREEYARAYSYLSPTIKGYPASQAIFEANIQSYSWNFRLGQEVTISVEEPTITGSSATVTVSESRFQEGDLFDSGQYTNTFDMKLHLEDGEWKIVHSSYYFAWCWSLDKGCE